MINLNISNQSLDIKFIWFGKGTLSKLDESIQEGKKNKKYSFEHKSYVKFLNHF